MTPTTAPVCFVDTETLGLDADVQPIWEVALILPDGREWVRQIEVTPREISLAHPKALEIGRFVERYGVDTITPEELASDLWQIGLDGVHLAGAVVSFDEERLRRLLWRFGYTPPWHYHIIDVEALAVGYLAGQWAAAAEIRGADHEDEQATRRAFESATPPWKSEDLSRSLNVDPDAFEKHTALGDARWAKALYEAVMS